MEPLMNQSLHICGCCKRELPHEAFYTNKRTGTLDNYCKECRKANTRKRRDLRRCTSFENKPVSYPVITEVKTPLCGCFLFFMPVRLWQKVSHGNKKKKN